MNDNNNSFERIFWKVIHNKYLFNIIFYWIEYRGLNETNQKRIKYKNIHSMEWMLLYGQYSLLKCKLMANEDVDGINSSSMKTLFSNRFGDKEIDKTTFIEIVTILLNYKKELCYQIIDYNLLEFTLGNLYEIKSYDGIKRYEILELLTNKDYQFTIKKSTLIYFLKCINGWAKSYELTINVCDILLKSYSFSNVMDESLKSLIRVNSSVEISQLSTQEEKKQYILSNVVHFNDYNLIYKDYLAQYDEVIENVNYSIDFDYCFKNYSVKVLKSLIKIGIGSSLDNGSLNCLYYLEELPDSFFKFIENCQSGSTEVGINEMYELYQNTFNYTMFKNVQSSESESNKTMVLNPFSGISKPQYKLQFKLPTWNPILLDYKDRDFNVKDTQTIDWMVENKVLLERLSLGIKCYSSYELIDYAYSSDPYYQKDISYLYKTSYIDAILLCDIQAIKHIESRIKDIIDDIVEFKIPSEVFNQSFKSNGIEYIKKLINHWYEADYPLFKIGTFNNYITELSTLFGESCIGDIEIQEQLSIKIGSKRFTFSKLLHYQIKNHHYKSTTLIFNKSNFSKLDNDQFITEQKDNPVPQYLYDEDLNLCKIPAESKLHEIENTLKFWFGQLETKQDTCLFEVIGKVINYIFKGLVQVQSVTMELVKQYHSQIELYGIQVDHSLYHSFHYLSIRSPVIINGYILKDFSIDGMYKYKRIYNYGDLKKKEEDYEDGKFRYDCNIVKEGHLHDYFLPVQFTMEFIFDSDFTELLKSIINSLSFKYDIYTIFDIGLFEFLLMDVNREDLFFHYLKVYYRKSHHISFRLYGEQFRDKVLIYFCNSNNTESIDKFILFIHKYGSKYQFEKLLKFAITNGTKNNQIVEKLKELGIN